MLRQKISAFRFLGLKGLKIKTNKLFFIIPVILVLLGVLFLGPKTAYPSQVEAQTLIELTNKERAERGLPALFYNEALTLAARNKASDLLEGGYFSHNEPNGRDFSDWVRAAGYDYAYTGENLAMDFVTSQGVINGWMASGKHRENILGDKYTEIGIAAVSGDFSGKKTVMVVQIFGKPMNKDKDDYLAVERTFLLPRFLSPNVFDIFIPKTTNKTRVKHNEIKSLAVLNSGHLKLYHNYNNTYWGAVDTQEFQFKKVRITMLGQEGKRLDLYPWE